MRTLLFLLLAASLKAMPTVNVHVYEMPSAAAKVYALAWCREDPERRGIAVSEGTSMEPLLHAGDWNLMERPDARNPIRRGDYVLVDEGPGRRNVGHLVHEVRGDAVFITNLNAARSDGWYKLSAIKWVIRGVVRPDGGGAPPLHPNAGRG